MRELLLSLLKAFVLGGAFCLIAQLLIDKTKLSPARILTAYVVAGVVLGGLRVYERLVEIFDCGATTPLTGFGYLISEGVREAVDKKGLAGVLSGGLTAASAGIGAALVFGLAAAVVFRSKRK